MSDLEQQPDDVMPEPQFTYRDQFDLDAAEKVIAEGLQTFVDVGRKFAEIRDRRLYRQDHPSFEAYLSDRWQMSRKRGYDLISAARVVSQICDSGQISPPTVESHAAALARVPEDARAEVWQRVLTETDGKPTAAAVREAALGSVAQELPSPRGSAADVVGLNGEVYRAAHPVRDLEGGQDLPVDAECSMTAVLTEPDLSPVEREEVRRQRVATDFLLDHVVPLAQMSNGDGFEYYRSGIAIPRPLTPEMMDKAITALQVAKQTITERNLW